MELPTQSHHYLGFALHALLTCWISIGSGSTSAVGLDERSNTYSQTRLSVSEAVNAFSLQGDSRLVDLVCSSEKTREVRDWEDIAQAQLRALSPSVQHDPKLARDISRLSHCLIFDKQRTPGSNLLLGAYLTTDEKQRVFMLRKAAQAGNFDAMYRYAIVGLKQRLFDYKEFLYWVTRAATEENPQAQYLLARHFEDRRRDKRLSNSKRVTAAEREIFWLKQYVKNDNPRHVACTTDPFGAYASDPEVCKEARSLAFLSLGTLFWLGENGVGRDYSQAASWLQASVDAGQYGGADYLALMYEKGLGVPKDIDKARHLQQLYEEHNKPAY